MQKFLEILKSATDIQPILDRLRSGRIILTVLSILYRVVAVIIGIALIVVWFATWQLIGEMNFFGGVALLIWQVFFPYASFLVAKVLYLRAREIKDYPDSDYVVVPVMAMVTKTNGEMILTFLAVMSVPAMLITWFSGGAMPVLSDFEDLGNAFFGGIAAFLLCWAIGFLMLVLTQLLAEWTLAIFSIANDTNILRRNLVRQDEPQEYDSAEAAAE
jgi:hypothetical protein